GRPVVPVFWIAAEDHDWAEVDHVYVLDRQDELVRLRLPAHGMPHQMVHAIQLQPAAVEQVLQEAYARLPDAPDKAELLRTLQAAWRPGDTLANWFARLLWRWVAPHGLVVLNPCWPGLRELAAPVWEHTLAHLDHVQAELEAAYAAVAATGASPEVVRDTTHSTVFYVDERGRRFVLEDTGRGSLRARGLGVEQPVATWLALARECPESFSANVLLRPVVQDHLLPTLAYVGGPSEIAYHPLARGVFRVHERNLPPLVLRDRLQWYPPEVLRNLEKWRLPLHELDCTPRDLTTSVLADLGGERVTAAAVDLATTAAAAWGRFADALRDLGPQVDSIVRAQRRREQAGMERAVRKVQRLLEQRHETALRQLRHIERWLWTDGHPQERRLSPLNVWSRYGWSWLVELPFWGDYRAPLGVYHVLERGLESDVVGVETEGSAT
ncbi:MAG: bacillithiol biosynthesis cysteine-adding enzyme BshC, partial [Alicyclobacillus sp.]|nr:bacillithiol biosynthesis cysteine-adding enzyme BshC [Alicyclobacillus sp.]